MLFSTMRWLLCYSFLIMLDTTVHHISYESEDMLLLKHICNYNFMQLCFNLKIIKIILDKFASGFSPHGKNSGAAVSSFS